MTRACSVCASPNPLDLQFCSACGTPLPATPASAPDSQGPQVLGEGFAPLPEGTKIRDETLVLVQVLGQGGFGITYRAREFSSNRTIAVKELFPFGCVRQNGHVTPSTLLDQDAWAAAREGFRREGALLSNHTHPNVVQVLDVWDERGTTFLAMEFLDGQTLAQVLQGGALGVRRVRAMIGQLAGALSLLHGAGMLHRDIKPENIMLVRDPMRDMGAPSNSRASSENDRWVLLDFGSARAFATGKTLALTQIVTPGYAPLEQYASRARGGPPSDIYALAATAYHALTGVAPPPATERASNDELRSPESLNPNIPRPLSEAIVRALSLRVDGRPQTVEAWLRELDGAPPASTSSASAASPFASPIPLAAAPPTRVRAPMGPEVAPPIDLDHSYGAAMEPFERNNRLADPLPSTSAASQAALSTSQSTSPSTSGGPGSTSGSSGTVVKMESVMRSFELAQGDGDTWYRVTVESRRIAWPRKCACCGAGLVVPMNIRTPAIWWQLPYCASCREHAERGEAVSAVTNLTCTVLGIIGVLCLGFEAWRVGLMLLVACAGVKVVSQVLLSGLSAVQRLRVSSQCCHYGPAARFKERVGDRYVWEFRSRVFAEEFCALNGGDVNNAVAVPVAAPSTPSTPNKKPRERVST